MIIFGEKSLPPYLLCFTACLRVHSSRLPTKFRVGTVFPEKSARDRQKALKKVRGCTYCIYHVLIMYAHSILEMILSVEFLFIFIE